MSDLSGSATARPGGAAAGTVARLPDAEVIAPTRRQRRHRPWVGATRWLALAAAAAMPLAVARLPPLYDYYHWLFSARLIQVLMSGSPADRHVVEQAVALRWMPVPNQGAQLALVGLASRLPLLAAGRVLALVAALALAASFAVLVRVVAGRTTAVSPLGLPFAFGYFLYKGYLSYLLGLSLALAGLALLERSRRLRRDGPSRRTLLLLAGSFVGIYLCHVIGWATLGIAAAAHAVALARERRWRAAAGVAGSILPSLALLAAYLLGRQSAAIEWYATVGDKVLSLVSPLALFLRLHPLAETLPVTVLCLVGLGLIAAAVLAGVDRQAGSRSSRRLLAIAGICALVALAIPFSGLGGMSRPDERFVLPAVLIALAALPCRRAPKAEAFATLVALGLVLLHVPEYAAASRELESIAAVTRVVIPGEATAMSVVVFESRLERGCDDEGLPAITVPVTKWLGLLRLIDLGAIRVNLMETSLLRRSWRGPPDMYVWTRTPEEAESELWTGRAGAPPYEYVDVAGCPADLNRARRALRGEYAEIVSRDRFAIFHLRDAGDGR